MDVITIVVLFGIFCLLGLMYIELRKFVEHICKPTPPQMPMMVYDPSGGHPRPPKRRSKGGKKEPMGFRPPEKTETTEEETE